ncbi:O-antigen ligase family protein [Haloarchaeobius sp. HRN-SO-5]|uniref:O-antigen ligase family protein n=1 Tax=Haloarchaeobius sp. HRN-SO-5 TaxID=3446118 RepID=UPI003EB90C05
MQSNEVAENTEFPDAFRLESAVSAFVYVALSTLLAVTFLGQANGTWDFFAGWRIATLYLLFAVLVVSRHHFFSDTRTAERSRNYVLGLVASVVLFEILFRSRSPGVGLGWFRPLDYAVVFVLVLAAVLVYPDYERFSTTQLAFVGCFSVLVGLFFYHSLGVDPNLAASRWPIWASFVAACNLLVVPRFVSERAYLWVVAGLSALATTLGLVAVVGGGYTLLFFDVVPYGSKALPFTGVELPVVRSLFTNPNMLGLVTFAGATASFVEFRRAVADRRWALSVVAASLFGLTSVGLVLSFSRASWLAATVTLGLYLAYEFFDRSAIPTVTLVGGVLTLGLVGTVYTGVLPIDPSRRFVLWQATIDAYTASPSLLGEGHISTSQFIEPYLPAEFDGTNSPHNSYLSILVRMGLLGFVAYVALVVGAIVHGTSRYQRVNVAMLAMTVGWSVHQLFEAYTLVQWTTPAVLATIPLGYLLFGDRTGPPNAPDPTDGRNQS